MKSKQMTRKTLAKPEAEIILFGVEDIVTQSLEFTPDEYEDNPRRRPRLKIAGRAVKG